ncbi:50S ribosomal protein L9 [Rickettsiales endosymbiont of Stachyamoeba lipophora]|uniref:50S ribosomal protein L9 n=1 Tax=Rickettsiales endosymbiont of Stachyamoeba lipophora TaxID=2486578 RepID=UPI000F647B84|nr:50S ribosomal protein L9 [Rickettsiales endosymbiont of Stachyamoeba lipophora]AZL15470.1 50S ribosomal protein L9 [Rickettsiales endosymbiont of Stachyamoeba lipophora]
MEIILIEKVKNLGDIGLTVNVKNGFARNYLIPQGKAIRATEENKKFYIERQAAILNENNNKREQAEQEAQKLPTDIVVIRQAAEDDRLFGSVNSRDIANGINEKASLNIARSCIDLNQVIKYIGIYEVDVALHPEVITKVIVNISRSEGEARNALESYKSSEKQQTNEN